MGYEIFFVRRDPGQSFEDALDAVEESFRDDPKPPTAAELEMWDQLVDIARDVLGEDVEVYDDELATRELVHRTSGIQLSLFNGEVSLHVRGRGAAGSDVTAQVADLARDIEDETGLEGYDTQLRAPVTEGESDGRPEPRAWYDEEGRELDGTSTTLPAVRSRRQPELSGAPATFRWWEFWKR